MKLIATIFALAFLTLITACSKEEVPVAPKAKPTAIQAAKAAAALANINSGQKVYQINCAACHATGLLGAPKLGDKKEWASHLHNGLKHLVQKAINGVGSMPAKGGNMKLSDHEIKLAVEYMIEQSR
jgi:cytochrome c5